MCKKQGQCPWWASAGRYRRTADGWKISATGYDRTYDVSLSTAALDFKAKPGRAIKI